MGIQINHAGASAMSSRIGMQPVSASRFPSKAGGEIPRGLSKEEIASIAKIMEPLQREQSMPDLML